jgi:hypothetical protein
MDGAVHRTQKSAKIDYRIATAIANTEQALVAWLKVLVDVSKRRGVEAGATIVSNETSGWIFTDLYSHQDSYDDARGAAITPVAQALCFIEARHS